MGSVSRVLAIDLGKKRVGLALSDPTGRFALGLETLEITANTNLVTAIQTVCEQHQVQEIVLGLPLKMSGEEGPGAKRARQLAGVLQEKLALPVHLLDERFTSVLAQQTLQAQGIQPSRHKGLIDQAAAKRILQDYLDQQR